MMNTRAFVSVSTMLFGLVTSSPTWADDPGPGGGGVNIVAAAKTGAQVYATVCQGCHMADGKGGVGAGRIPALARNPVVGSADYVLTMIIKGRGAMPPFGNVLDDQQMLQVTTYIRTHFGNRYPEDVSMEQIKAIRQSSD